MATQEFYIRNETDTEARGPFTIEQLSSLIDSGQVKPGTLYYDPTTEQWTGIDQDEALKEVLFPEKKRLTMRVVQPSDTLTKERGTSAPIMVNDLLAAAEGRTNATKGRKDPHGAMALTARSRGGLIPSSSYETRLRPRRRTSATASG